MLAKVVLFGSLVSCSTLADVHGLTQQRERERGGRERTQDEEDNYFELVNISSIPYFSHVVPNKIILTQTEKSN